MVDSLIYQPMSQIRTPPSLKWLIDKRSRLLGEIAKYENSRTIQIEKAQTALEQAQYRLTYEKSIRPKIISVLKAELEAIDIALGLHEIKIDPGVVPETRTYDVARTLPYGNMTRNIFECLKLAGGRAMTTTDIAAFVAIKNGIDASDNGFFNFRESVRCRLKNLQHDGKIERASIGNRALDARWTLK